MRSQVWSTLILAAGVTMSVACEQQSGGPTAISGVDDGPRLAVYGLGYLHRATPREMCATGPYRDFDFWVGEWAVEDPAGNQVGTNIVRSELGGCLVAENWTSADGGRGRSLNMYDASTGKWYQAWMDIFAQHLRLEGGLLNGEMVLSGDRQALSGVPITDQITWTPTSVAEVRQFWQIAVHVDPPFTVTAFDGRYMRRDQVDPAPPAPSSYCSDAAFDQLDFWLGTWTVEADNGLRLGTAVVSEDLNNCLIEERFSTGKGYESVAFMGFDPRPGLWYRHSMDNQGLRLQASGTTTSGTMVLTGDGPTPEGGRVEIRNEIAEQSDGSVRQAMYGSRDGGATWKTDVVLIYRRR
jgi:hypothetical protein